MINVLLVAVGSGLGGMARYGMGLAAARLWGESFPWGTLLINVLGSLVIGWFGAASTGGGALPDSAPLRLLVMVGVCGGFTTFSSFSLQTMLLVRQGQASAALANIVLSVGLCLGAVTLGSWAGRPAARESGVIEHRVLALLATHAEARAVLDAAACWAQAIAVPTIAVARLDPDAIGPMPGEEVIGTTGVSVDVADHAALDQALAVWQGRSAIGVVDLAGPLDATLAAARLVVMGMSAASSRLLHTVLLADERAVLLVPAAAPATYAIVAVSGQASAARDRALQAAHSMLLRATQVVWLDPGLSPLAGARAAGAGLLVAGAMPAEGLAQAAIAVLLHA